MDIPVILKCDRLEMVNVARRFYYIPSLNIAYFNLAWYLHKTIKLLPVTPEFEHIKGYQDEGGSELDLQASMNTAANIKAKLALWKAVQKSIDNPLINNIDRDLPIITCKCRRTIHYITSYL